MIPQEDREEIEGKIISAQKRVQKEILNLGEFVLSEDKFKRFKYAIFNHFGKSGLETEVKKILDEYSEKSE